MLKLDPPQVACKYSGYERCMGAAAAQGYNYMCNRDSPSGSTRAAAFGIKLVVESSIQNQMHRRPQLLGPGQGFSFFP